MATAATDALFVPAAGMPPPHRTPPAAAAAPHRRHTRAGAGTHGSTTTDSSTDTDAPSRWTPRIQCHSPLVVFLLCSAAIDLLSSSSLLMPVSAQSSTGVDGSTGTIVVDDHIRLYWHWEYILASIIIATLGCGTSLQVMMQRTGFYGVRNWLCLIGGSVSLGAIGIWCMHFVGMMSLTLYDADGNQLRMGFNPGITVASLMIAIVIITAGFALAGDPKQVKIWRTCIVGFIGGCGVAAMHYTGMIAMVCQAKITWDAGIIVASVVVGVVACTAALLIFFHLGHLWQNDLRLRLGTAVIMGLAVNAMHYTGMQAAHWHNSFEEPDFSGYATKSTLTGAIIALAVATCVILLGILGYHYRRLHMIETRKKQKLTLAAVVRNSQGRLLTTLAGTLPSVVINTDTTGITSFDRINVDFLRMLKISFSWTSAERYTRHLAKLHANGSVSASSLDMFTKYVAAARDLAALLNIPVESLGFMYYSPTGNMLTIIVKAQQANSMFLENSGLRFVPPAQVKQSLSEFQLPPDVDPDEWLESLKEYQRRVMMPVFGGQRDELLNELLREVAQELLVDADQLDGDVLEWRQALGKYVSTRHHLKLLSRHTAHWAQVKIDPMVKTQIEATFAEEEVVAAEAENADADQESTVIGTGTKGPTTPVSRVLPSAVAPSTLYLGMFYVQATPSGMRVLLQRKGALNMVPLVKFEKQHAVTRRDLEYIRENAMRATMQRNTGHMPTGSGASDETHDRHRQVRLSSGDTTDRPTHYRGSSADDTDRTGKSYQAPPRHGSSTSDDTMAFTAASRRGTAQSKLHAHHPVVLSEAFLSFQADLNKSITDLGKVLGTRADLTPQNLWTSSVLALSPEVHVILFVHCTMSTTFPPEYSAIDCEFLPFTIFEIIHYSTFTSRAAQNWTRKYIANRLNARPGGQTAPGLAAVAKHADQADGLGLDDHGFHSMFGSSTSKSTAGSLLGIAGTNVGRDDTSVFAPMPRAVTGESTDDEGHDRERQRHRQRERDNMRSSVKRPFAIAIDPPVGTNRDEHVDVAGGAGGGGGGEALEQLSPSVASLPGHIVSVPSSPISPANQSTSERAMAYPSTNRRGTATGPVSITQHEGTARPPRKRGITMHGSIPSATAAAASPPASAVPAGIVMVQSIPRQIRTHSSRQPHGDVRSPVSASAVSPGAAVPTTPLVSPSALSSSAVTSPEHSPKAASPHAPNSSAPSEHHYRINVEPEGARSTE